MTTELRGISSFVKYADHISADKVEKTEKLSVLAAKNGYECAQILVFPDEDTEYDVKLSDFYSADGTVYHAENVTVYAEKYIYVDRNWQTNGLPTGNYPDALLPLDAAKKYGQTRINAGCNKGIWLEFFVPTEQKAGIYLGTVTVKANGIWEYPIELEVLDLRIPSHIGLQTLFHTNFQHMSHYEKGNMEQMYEKYLRYLLKHRICQTGFIISEFSEDAVNLFANKAAELYRQGYNTFNIPSAEKQYNGYKTFSEEWLEKYLFALAKKSLECGFDIVKQAVFYDWLIDEPFGVKYKPGQEQESVERFTQCVNRLADRCVAMPEFACDFGAQVISSLRNICHVITDYYKREHFPNRQKLNKNGEPYQYDCEKVTLCPKFDGYDTRELAAPYGNCQERWWYGCNAPNAPYVSYHIDDATFSPRIIGGMMARYGIRGTLYWANNIYTEINTTGKPLFLEDPYQTAHRGFGANGEGAILYPGSLYGVDGPVGCIRLKNIREGHQDWDIFNQTNLRYQEQGASFWDIYDRQICYIADAAKIDSIHGDYGMIHSSLMRLCEAAMAPLGLVVHCKNDVDGVRYQLKTREKCRVLVDGKCIPEENGCICFSHSYQPGGWLEISIQSESGSIAIPVYMGRGMQIILLESLFKKTAVTVQQGRITRNPDEIRREITVELDAPDTVHIRLDDAVTKGQELGFEIKTVEPCYCTVYADGYEHMKCRIKTIPRWNRIQIPTASEGFCTKGINICFDEPGKFGVGDVFIRR